MTFSPSSERRNPTLEEIRQTLRAHLPELQGIFGSYARNEPRPDSDLDILMELEDPPGPASWGWSMVMTWWTCTSYGKW